MSVAVQDASLNIDYFLNEPTICRLYSATAALDPETAGQMRKDLPVGKAKIYAHVLDFFGSMFELRDGKAMVPGKRLGTVLVEQGPKKRGPTWWA